MDNCQQFIKILYQCSLYLSTYNHRQMTTSDKRLFNRYDQFEIASIFTESAQTYLSRKLKQSRKKFYIKALLGVLLFVNAYLSHWGPWRWPANYYLIAFSIIFYHFGAHLYKLFTGIKNLEGNHVGDYIFQGQVRSVVLRIGKDSIRYTLDTSDKDNKVQRQLVYTDYFTVEGYFLERKYLKEVKSFIAEVNKLAKK